MQTYESVLVFDPAVAEADIEERLKKLEKRITPNGGEIVEIARWGKRRLAYPIKKRESGQYVVMSFKAPASNLVRLERVIRLDEAILRHLIIVKGE